MQFLSCLPVIPYGCVHGQGAVWYGLLAMSIFIVVAPVAKAMIGRGTLRNALCGESGLNCVRLSVRPAVGRAVDMC